MARRLGISQAEATLAQTLFHRSAGGMLLSGRVDFILGALRPTPGPQLSTESLLIDRMAMLAGARHPLAARRRVAVPDLAAYPWVLSRAGTPLRDALEAYFASEGCPMPQPAVETGDLALVRGLLVHGEMVAPLSEHQMRYEADTAAWWCCRCR